ncbi:MAG: homoserine dehydrogenase [Symbiobacteriia bacterium]
MTRNPAASSLPPSEPRELRLAVRGFGHVGQAFARILAERGEGLERRYGLRLLIVAAADSTGAVWSTGGLAPAALLAAKARGGLAHYEAAGPADAAAGRGSSLAAIFGVLPCDVLVDLSPTDVATGGEALTDSRRALQAGLHLVTANKGPLVAAWRELTELAAARGLGLKYGGATAAALPTASLAHYELAGSNITRLEGVLNGTSNFILTAMAAGRDYQAALTEAQARGIAERDPRLDVEGYDTAVKLLLLCNSLFGASLTLADIARQGITKVTGAQAAAARERGGGLKLLARAWREVGGDVRCEVAVTELPSDHLLAHVDGTEKGIVYHTDLLGRLAVIGGGSGPTPAAASVLRDIINLARELGLARG